MNWKLFIGIRYLTRRSKERFISIISVISVLGVMVGVAALIVVLSVMTGFDMEIKEKIIGTYSHIIVLKEGGIENTEEVTDILRRHEHVVASSPFIDGPTFLQYRDNVLGVVVRGLDENREKFVSNVQHYIEGGKLDFGNNGVILGSELAKTLRLTKGNVVSLLLPSGKKMDFTVTGTFSSGRYDYDANMVFIGLENAKKLFNKKSVSGIGVRVDNEFNVHRIRKSLQHTLRYPFTVKTWMDLDKNLMRALAIEKKMMFVILALIILVACFNIASSLILQVLEKTRDIGILRALGARANDIRAVFIFLGFLIGCIGVIFGGMLGLVISYNINDIASFIERFTGFELFPSDIYYLSDIPVKIEQADIALIAVLSLGLAVIASLYPAWKASRLNPVEAIRYE